MAELSPLKPGDKAMINIDNSKINAVIINNDHVVGGVVTDLANGDKVIFSYTTEDVEFYDKDRDCVLGDRLDGIIPTDEEKVEKMRSKKIKIEAQEVNKKITRRYNKLPEFLAVMPKISIKGI